MNAAVTKLPKHHSLFRNLHENLQTNGKINQDAKAQFTIWRGCNKSGRDQNRRDLTKSQYVVYKIVFLKYFPVLYRESQSTSIDISFLCLIFTKLTES